MGQYTFICIQEASNRASIYLPVRLLNCLKEDLDSWRCWLDFRKSRVIGTDVFISLGRKFTEVYFLVCWKTYYLSVKF